MLSNPTTFLLVAFSVFSTAAGAADSASADPSSKRPAIGTQVADFEFTDIRYLKRTLSDFGDRKAFVIVFVTRDCPIARRSMPRLKAIDEQYRDKAVQLLAINVGPLDSVVDVAQQAVEANIAFPFAKDFNGDAVAAVGASRTPECVVLDADRKLRYRGRIDSANRYGGVSPQSVRRDLCEALDDVLAGREVRIPETPVEGCLITKARQPMARDLTYYRDIAPLIRKHCRSCHQPDSAGPFSLLALDDVTAHAAMISEVVSQRRMPPWHAAGDHGHFVNDPRLPESDIATIIDWIHGDQRAGEPTQAIDPVKPKVTENDWLIGEPDLVLRLPAQQEIPAEGYIPYRYAILPYVFLQDTWVQKIQINPGNDAVVHHCNMGYADVTDIRQENFNPEQNFITGFVPGGDPMVLDSGIGFCIPAGSIIGLQIHYVTTGKAETDQTAVGFVFAKETIQKQIKHFQCHTSRFAIPPGASHHEVRAARVFEHDATGIGMYCHMHLRGKDMAFYSTTPDGTHSTLLSVPNYNFEWQSSYRWPAQQVHFSKGTRIDCVAHFDNSTFNPFNPDSAATVRHGQQTYHEMMYGFLFFTHDEEALNLTVDPSTGHVVR